MRTVAAVVAFVVCVHAALWALLQRHQAIANIENPLASVPLALHPLTAPMVGIARPERADPGRSESPQFLYAGDPHLQQRQAGGELVPGIAAEFGLKVALGIWIDKNEARNEREIQAAIEIRRRNRNVNAIVVGNETIYRAEKSVP